METDIRIANRIIQRLRDEKLALEGHIEFLEETMCMCETRNKMLQIELNSTREKLEVAKQNLASKTAMLLLTKKIKDAGELN